MYYTYILYILYSKKIDRLYKGTTSNLKRRITEHNSKNVPSTRNGVPWMLIYYAAFTSKKDSRCEEIFLKTGKGRERIKLLLADTLDKIQNIE